MAAGQHSTHSCGARSGAGRPSPAFVGWGLFLLLAYTTWGWAGLRPSLHIGGVALAGVLLAGLLAGRPEIRHAVLRDPVFSLGLAFLTLLILQWANAGRVQYFDAGYRRWMYMPPRWPGWPFAFAPADARQMLAWFFPAWVVALALRAPVLDPRQQRNFLMALVGNAGLLVLFGLAQYISGTSSIYWRQPLKGHFFASFAYGNHAPPFFVMASALTAGLLYREVFDARRFPADTPSATRLRHPGRVALLAPLLVLCLTGAFLGFSRTGVVLATLLGGFVVGYGWLRGWRVLTPAGRVNFVALSLGCAAIVYFAVAGLGESGIRREFKPKLAAPDAPRTLWEHIDRELDRRPRFALAALSIWRAHPWFGVGGWGYKYLVAEEVSEKYWLSLAKRGWANAHCDPLQFLAEFGLVGAGLLFAAVAVMVRQICRRECRRQALGVMSLAGLGLVMLFSLVDLPFRSPAILYTWVAVLAALPRVCRSIPPAAAVWPRGDSGTVLNALANRDVPPERMHR